MVNKHTKRSWWHSEPAKPKGTARSTKPTTTTEPSESVSLGAGQPSRKRAGEAKPATSSKASGKGGSDAAPKPQPKATTKSRSD